MSRWIGCPDSNFRRGRPFGLRPEAVVVHIMDGSFAAGESVFRDPTSHKSAHYGISRDGEVDQYVDENDTAFHAGIVINPTWPLLKPRVNPNFYTIGIEHEGRPDDVWPEALLSASATLIGQIAARWDIPLDESHVIRHHQIRASKTCPGNWLQIGELLKRVPAAIEQSTLTTSSQQSGASDAGTISPVPSISVSTPVTSTVPMGAPSTISPAPAKIILVRTIRNVNLRRARPATSAQVVRVIPGHTDVVVSRFELGERVEGNVYWYADVQGNYLWAGATNAPDPTVTAA
jgi:N-acetylmuramoyl-L-alanine amidase